MVLVGASLGAVASLSTAWRHPGGVGGLVLLSGSFIFDRCLLRERGSLFTRIADFVDCLWKDPRDLPRRIFVSCGIYEGLIGQNRALVDFLRQRGRAVWFPSRAMRTTGRTGAIRCGQTDVDLAWTPPSPLRARQFRRELSGQIDKERKPAPAGQRRPWPNASEPLVLSLGADICWPICYEELIRRLDLAIPLTGTPCASMSSG